MSKIQSATVVATLYGTREQEKLEHRAGMRLKAVSRNRKLCAEAKLMYAQVFKDLTAQR